MSDDHYLDLKRLDQCRQVVESSKAAVIAALRGNKPEEIEATLENFFVVREDALFLHKDACFSHIDWVGGLLKFIDVLWERRMVKWIKKFNEVAIKKRIHDDRFDDIPSYCSSLVHSFDYYAKFDDKPADFGLMLEDLHWLKKLGHFYSDYLFSLIAIAESGHFRSENELVVWKERRKAESLNSYVRRDYVRETRESLNRPRAITIAEAEAMAADRDRRHGGRFL